MRLAVFSHKYCWHSTASPTGFATDGGFALQMRALADLFDSVTLVVPCGSTARSGETPLTGRNLSVAALSVIHVAGVRRKAIFPLWLMRNYPVIGRQLRSADAVHAAIPGDVGTIGMLMAFISRKPLLVRHCGNWGVQSTLAEHLWKGFMEWAAGGRNVMLATGGGTHRPSHRNRAIAWIFATTLTDAEIRSVEQPRELPTGGRARLVIICRLDPKKGVSTVINSLPAILRHQPGATLDIVGEGVERTALEMLAERLGVRDRVTFHGNVTHGTVLRVLRDADLFCYPTRASEGFPKVVLEAMACGVPVIATGVSVLASLLAAGGGYLLDSPSAPALSEAVRTCLADADRYRVMSGQALKTARKYSLEQWSGFIGDSLRQAWGSLRTHA